MTNHQKNSKSDDFGRVCAIINHDLFWSQKQSKTYLWMTLGLIFNHLFSKHHFGAFSVFYSKNTVIFEEKKSQLKNVGSKKNVDTRSYIFPKRCCKFLMINRLQSCGPANFEGDPIIWNSNPCHLHVWHCTVQY